MQVDLSLKIKNDSTGPVIILQAVETIIF